MFRTFFTSSTAGALFGAGLVSSRVYLPQIIISQMQLSSFYMLKVFITASASSAIVIHLFEALGVVKSTPRSPSSLGLFSRYDGNVIGGTLVGLGMALTGACPGTVLVQLASSVQSGWYVLFGGALGGILWAWPVSAFFASKRDKAPGPTSPDMKPTVQSRLGMSTVAGVAAYVLLCVGMLGAVTALEPWPSPGRTGLHPVIGGAVIGAAQAATLLLTGNTIGVSTGYEVFGQYFWWVLSVGDAKSGPAPPVRSLYFIGGIVAGALAFSRSEYVSVAQFATAVDITALRGVVGGFVMVLGARLAGGCTSGHGISGMSMLGISSFITVACMFAGGIGATWIIG